MLVLVASAVLLGLSLLPLLAWIARTRSTVAALGTLLSAGAAFGVLAPLALSNHVPESRVEDRPIEVAEADDVGSDACRACHPREYETWDTSYHSSMTQLPSRETVQARWDQKLTTSYADDQVSIVANYRLLRRGEEFWVHSPDDPAFARGPLRPGYRKIVLVTGSHHQQFFWYATGNGREVAQLPIAYRMVDERWLPVNTLFMTPPQRQGALSGAWNLVCFRCHSTHGRPGAVRREGAPGGSVVTPDTFGALETQATELGIACESCHGGAREHAEKQRNPLQRYASHFGEREDPTITNPARLDSKRAADVCGRCHSNHMLGDGTPEALAEINLVGFSFRPGDVLSESLWVPRLRERDDPNLQAVVGDVDKYFAPRVWPDGMPSSAGRELNGLMESACFEQGELSCLSCHQMHRASDDPRPPLEWANDQLDHRKLGNEACLGCHESFRARISEHTKHPEDSTGSLCYNCHMPNTAFGLMKQSRSHEIDSPSVQSTLETGRPNACSLCHLDHPLQQTARTLESWYGIEAPVLDLEHHFTAFGAMEAIRGDAAVRAMLAWHMGWEPAIEVSGGDWMPPVLSELLDDPYTSVRYTAGRSLRAHPGFEDFDYDYVAPRAPRDASAREALERWQRATPPATRRAREPVLLERDGSLNRERFDRLREMRDDRHVFRME